MPQAPDGVPSSTRAPLGSAAPAGGAPPRSADWLVEEVTVVDQVGPVLALVGAALGAAGGYLGALRGTSQRERAARREEWGRRFTAALDDVSSETFRRRELGRAVLVELASSALASPEERELARVVLDTGARIDARGSDVTAALQPGLTVDDVEFVEDNDGDVEGGAP